MAMGERWSRKIHVITSNEVVKCHVCLRVVAVVCLDLGGGQVGVDCLVLLKQPRTVLVILRRRSKTLVYCIVLYLSISIALLTA